MNIANTPWLDSPGVMARSYASGIHLGQHLHRDAQLLFAASGVMQVTTPKGRWLVPPQRAVWLPAGIVHSADMLADVELRALLISPDRVAHHAEAKRLGREFVVAVGPLLRALILASFMPDRRAGRRTLLTELALYELAEAEDAATFMPLPSDPRARRVADLVLADPAGASGLDDLAASSGSSSRTITRLFTVETGFTFKEWRQRARIMAAVVALGSGPSSIKQVAGQLGFSSVAAFGHAFRQVMQLTPSDFQRHAAAQRSTATDAI